MCAGWYRVAHLGAWAAEGAVTASGPSTREYDHVEMMLPCRGRLTTAFCNVIHSSAFNNEAIYVHCTYNNFTVWGVLFGVQRVFVPSAQTCCSQPPVMHVLRRKYSSLLLQSKSTRLGDQVLIHCHILARLFPVSTLLDATERRLGGRRVSLTCQHCVFSLDLPDLPVFSPIMPASRLSNSLHNRSTFFVNR